MALSWSQINNPSVQPKAQVNSIPRKNMSLTCDTYCTDKVHSPGCALAQIISEGHSIPAAIAACENAIAYESVSSPTNPFWTQQRKYNPDIASDEETKKYKHLMLLLNEATYTYCDCGAKHDRGGHYHWCTTKKEVAKKQDDNPCEDIPF